jgi:membrane protein implicated in regulation of membrane protease activity
MTAAVVYLPLAHIGHWWWLFLFLAPGLLVLVGAIRTTIQERRKARHERSAGDDS